MISITQFFDVDDEEIVVVISSNDDKKLKEENDKNQFVPISQELALDLIIVDV